MRFEDRQHAGRLLAVRLEHLREEHPVVLGLTRGGIPAAFEVARRLAAPLDLVVVRKIRSPLERESSFGAIAEGGALYLNPTLVREAGLAYEDVAALAEAEIAEVARRVRLYRGAVPAPRLQGRLVLVVDDFVATGATVRAAARAARRRGAARVILAVPALAAAVAPELRADVDEIVALVVAEPARPLGDAYERREEVSDEAALEYLRQARRELVGAGLEHEHAGAS
jgi:putative phosphoribosyl transferase